MQMLFGVFLIFDAVESEAVQEVGLNFMHVLFGITGASHGIILSLHKKSECGFFEVLPGDRGWQGLVYGNRANHVVAFEKFKFDDPVQSIGNFDCLDETFSGPDVPLIV